MNELPTFFRVVAVGLLSNGAGYLIYLLLTSFGVDPKLAMSVLYAVGTCIGFFGNRTWSFGHTGTLAPAVLRYAATYLVGYAINWMMLYVFVDRLGYPHPLVQAAAIAVLAVYLFLGLRHFVFPRKTIESRDA